MAFAMFACEENSDGLDTGLYYPATKSAYAAWFPQLEYDPQRPYTCVVTYWASELIYRAGIMSQEEAWALPFEEKLSVIEQWNPHFEDQPEGTTVDKSINELYSHMYNAIHNYPGMDFSGTDEWDLMYETDDYPYVMCKLEAMHWKEFGRPETGLDETDNGSDRPSGSLPPVTEYLPPECARYTLHLLWSNNTVRYRYSKDFEKSKHVAYLESAMEEWRKASDYKLSFKKIKNNGWNKTTWGIGCNYHSFVDVKYGKKYAGQSSLGMVPWAILNFENDKASNPRTYLHELGHTLGLHHEHQRPDRDDYIDVFMKDIPSSWKSDYRKCVALRTFGSFDFESIMLYGSGLNDGDGNYIDAMRKKNGDTWEASRKLSQGDINGIRELYK